MGKTALVAAIIVAILLVVIFLFWTGERRIAKDNALFAKKVTEAPPLSLDSCHLVVFLNRALEPKGRLVAESLRAAMLAAEFPSRVWLTVTSAFPFRSLFKEVMTDALLSSMEDRVRVIERPLLRSANVAMNEMLEIHGTKEKGVVLGLGGSDTFPSFQTHWDTHVTDMIKAGHERNRRRQIVWSTSQDASSSSGVLRFGQYVWEEKSTLPNLSWKSTDVEQPKTPSISSEPKSTWFKKSGGEKTIAVQSFPESKLVTIGLTHACLAFRRSKTIEEALFSPKKDYTSAPDECSNASFEDLVLTARAFSIAGLCLSLPPWVVGKSWDALSTTSCSTTASLTSFTALEFIQAVTVNKKGKWSYVRDRMAAEIGVRFAQGSLTTAACMGIPQRYFDNREDKDRNEDIVTRYGSISSYHQMLDEIYSYVADQRDRVAVVA